MISLQEHEEILLLRRRHWIILVFGIIKIVLAMLVIVLVPIFAGPYFPEIVSGYGMVVLFGQILLFQILWVLLFLVIADYYLDAWIVTNNRLVFVELHGLFSRTLSSIEFSRIQDISVEVKGILATFLKYGNIKIYTAGNEQGVVFEEVGRPYELKDELLAIRDRLRKGSAHQEGEGMG